MIRHMHRAFVAYIFATFAIACGAASNGEAPLVQASRFEKEAVFDTSGRTSYIVDLHPEARLAYPETEIPQDARRFHPRHLPQFVNMIVALEKRYGFESREQTSWVGDSFVAALTPDQLAALRADPAVMLVTEETFMELSAPPPPWSDYTYSTPPYTETLSWGRTATNGKQSNGTVGVYIIDNGVGNHNDLAGVVLRVNASCSSAGTSGCPTISPVGCFPHATHVAGIIGATLGNFGVAGVLAGAPMYSVSVQYFTNIVGSTICANNSMLGGAVASGMDYVKWDIIYRGTYKVGIVNLSINGPEFTPGNSYNTKMVNMITPSVAIGGLIYPGAFIAQSAGNKYANACSWAFNYGGATPTSNSDGVMVVGGINSSGAAVVKPAGGFGFINTTTVNEDGSNFGPCVEVWAPSTSIWSTYGPNVYFNDTNSATWQDQSTTYGNYVQLSGTSMAAPHVAAAAAYLSQFTSYANPGAVETAVRSYFNFYGQYDWNSSPARPINIVQLP